MNVFTGFEFEGNCVFHAGTAENPLRCNAGSLDSFEPFFDVLTSQIGKYCAFYAHKFFSNNR
jgi:hypothetical protein